MKSIIKFFPFKYKLGISLFTIVLFVSSFLGLCQYIIMRNSLEDSFEQSKKLINDRVINIINNADYMNMLIEKPIEQEAKKILEAISRQYESNHDINFDLEPFRQGKENLHIYIIDESNTVVTATNKSEVGLDFTPWTDFVEYLEEVRNLKKFSTARISLSIIEDDLTKYCYMPSFDGKYIFETGSVIDEQSNYISGVGFDNFEETILKENDFIDSIILYDYEGVSYKKNWNGDRKKIAASNDIYFKQAITTMKPIKVIGQYNGRKAYYEYIPYQIAEAHGANERNVVEIIYNDFILRENLEANIRIIIIVVLIGAIISASLGYYIAKIITKPIEEITEGVNQVSKGNLSYEFPIKRNDEFALLGNQFNKMTSEINKLMEERFLFEHDLQAKNQEVFSQKEEISALYEETTALNEELESSIQQNLNSYFETVRALANAIDEKDPYTGGHCERVMEYATMIANELGLSKKELEDLKFGSILHDIGKIGISETILNKVGRLTENEYNEIKKHPEKGDYILRDLNFLNNCRKIIYEHHERVDGKGYPNGLVGEQIDLLAKIVCVADAYDAMTSSRPYRGNALEKKDAIEELLKNSGTQFDSEIVKVFIKVLM